MELYTTGQVAGALGMPIYRLDYLLRVGRLPDSSVRVGGKKIWTEEQVEELKTALQRYKVYRSNNRKGKDNG